ncbi:MAG: hypothetical protein SGPRY_008836, partial [Prymnesium sp.]
EELLAICNRLFVALIGLRQPQLSLFRLLAVLLPLSRSSYPQLRLRAVDSSARLLLLCETDPSPALTTQPEGSEACPEEASSRLYELWRVGLVE